MVSTPSDRRVWLVLSLKWSGEWLVWYRTGRAGYTACLMHAGRFTEAEARNEVVAGAGRGGWVYPILPTAAGLGRDGPRRTVAGDPHPGGDLKPSDFPGVHDVDYA